jgi:hypothetical protein
MLIRADMDLLARVLNIMLTAMLITGLLLLIAMLSHLGILLHRRPTMITVAMIIIIAGLAIHRLHIRPTSALTMDPLQLLDITTLPSREHLLRLETSELPLLQHALRLMLFELEDVLAKRVGR